MSKEKSIVGFAKRPPFGNATQVTFEYTNTADPNAGPRRVTVNDYFRNVHGITLSAPGLPVLNVGTLKDPQYMPVELCTVLPGQPFKRILNGDQTSEMLKFAARAPNQNAMSIAGTADKPGNGLRLFRLRDAPGVSRPYHAARPSAGVLGLST